MNEWEWQLLEEKTPVESIEVTGGPVRRGDRVKLRPRPGGDIFDLALDGKVATVESLEQDYEGHAHICVVVDDDPGRDIGMMRQPGHRFFFAPGEIEFVAKGEEAPSPQAKKILIAGIGNIFMGDDAFGVEVATRLAKHEFPSGVRVTDFGIRGFDLAYALMEGYDTTLLIDAYPGEGAPGSLFVIEPDLNDLTTGGGPQQGFVEPHAMNPVNVLRMAISMGGQLKRVLLVGCVPATLGPDEGHMGLSEPVTAAVDEAVKLVESLVTRILAGEWPGQK
jgi:hydrogenase maturation protease